MVENEECKTTPESPPEDSPESPAEENEGDGGDPSQDDPNTNTEPNNDSTNEDPTNIPPTTTPPTTPPTTEPVTTVPPCDPMKIVYNDVFWNETYPIPEVFYITNNYTIEPHSSLKINLSLTFEKNGNSTEGGYYVVSGETGKSDAPYYWPEYEEKSGREKKLTNMEIILESDNKLGLSSYSLMRRKNTIDESYLGSDCQIYNNMKTYSGVCEDGFVCNSEKNGSKCEQCENFECKECDGKNGKCTKCFSISVEGQWNPTGGSKKYLDCDLA